MKFTFQTSSTSSIKSCGFASSVSAYLKCYWMATMHQSNCQILRCIGPPPTIQCRAHCRHSGCIQMVNRSSFLVQKKTRSTDTASKKIKIKVPSLMDPNLNFSRFPRTLPEAKFPLRRAILKVSEQRRPSGILGASLCLPMARGQ